MTLDQVVIRTASRSPRAVAIRDASGALTYEELDALANQLARALQERGVRPGDRVGIWQEKSARAVAAMQGILRLGAAYVPLDPLSPAARAKAILDDGQMDVVVTDAARQQQLQAAGSTRLRFLGTGPDELASYSNAPLPPSGARDSDLAYILYTSGSTGTPKGVCISHRNAMAFIEWAHALLAVSPTDRLSNHAPFFFDLSVLDLYAAFLGGASVSLVPEMLAFSPQKLVKWVAEERITLWYSVPSALILMIQQGGLLDRADLSLRAVLFAGEPFPVKHLRPLRRHLAQARFFNLYGPTETNVCTFYEVAGVPDDLTEPVPIGRACCEDRVWLAPSDPGEGELTPSARGGEQVGELMVEGPTVMLGYWGHPPQGARPYATGDLCRLLPDGNYEYVGRRDHMLKVRGRRIEPGEIEAALLAHPAIREAVVIAAGSGLDARLVGCVVSAGGAAPTLLQLKRHCAERLPRYMIVDEVRVLPELPRTRNGKIDRRALAAVIACPQK
jgi:amino acid adenylation domain-containing protein